jgi:hypothetical protein
VALALFLRIRAVIPDAGRFLVTGVSMRSLRPVLALPLSLALTACGASSEDAPATTGTAAGDTLSVVEPGKEDNFLSLTAREYAVTGTTQVRIESFYAGKPAADRLARARELVSYRHVVVGWFLSQYLVEKERKDPNAKYGGFRSLTKNGSYEDLELRPVAGDELAFEMTFRQTVGGPVDLLSVMPTQLTPEGRRYFDLQIGRISTEDMQRLEINAEWYRQAPWEGFDPSKVAADRLETVRLFVEPEARSTDAWFDYAGLMDDGVLSVDMHFGWDYHAAYHLKHSREVYTTLVDRGFTSPVARYEDLKRDSGPLTTVVSTPNGPVEVRVRLYWGKPGTETDPDTDDGGRVLEADFRASLAESDVIVFSGHSGPFYGFALANWKKTSEGDVDDAELATAEMPTGRSQIVFAEGCDTYAIGSGFFQNPAKAGGEGLDVITTTAFSNAETAQPVLDFLDVFLEEGPDGHVAARRVSEFLRTLDGTSPWFSTMYGLHGIDDNPRRHPWADAGLVCDACRADADCGAGGRCVRMDGAKVCTAECSADESAELRGTISTKVCATPRGACDVESAARKAALVLDSVVPNPDRDQNGDGRVDDRTDESVTVRNAGGAEVSLTGYTLTDAVGPRFTFPRGFRLAAGASVTVFGGGTAGAGRFIAPDGLSLNNGGDTVRLRDSRGGLVDTLRWRSTPRPGFAVRH